ncbi:MAG: PadR family transcriptional regulator [Trueperella sp.]|nr:PadR family transcriptional regulator [Trueperella sp.]
MVSAEMIRGMVDILILSCLVNQPSYGYEISQMIAAHSGSGYLIKETTLYSAFRRLEKSGDVESFEGSITHGRSRTYYRLTAQGKQTLADKRAEWQQVREIVDAFVLRTPQLVPVSN